jgi:hypothetical protein
MKLIRQIETKVLLAATLTGIVVSSVACSAPTEVEQKGVTVAKLKAPRPMMKANASPASRKALGVNEWRIFRGTNDVVLTGYDEDGHAVKGLSVGFHAAASDATLRARVLDGSAFAARHDYARGRTSLNKTMPSATSGFLRQALSDIAALRSSFAKTTTSSKSKARTLGVGEQCGADMMSILTSALQCIQSSGGTDQNAIAQCIAAAQSAAGVGSACQGTGTIPFDPTQGGAVDPYGTGAGTGVDPNDPSGCACGDPYGTGAGGDPYGTGMGGDPSGSGMGDPWGGGAPTGDWCNDPFGDGASCPSCSGGAGGDYGGDIYTNPANGDVGGFGDYGSGAGDYGSDCFGDGY